MRVWVILNLIFSVWIFSIGLDLFYATAGNALAAVYVVVGIIIFGATTALIKKNNWPAYLTTGGFIAMVLLSAYSGNAFLETASAIMAIYNFTLLDWVAKKIKRENLSI
ncbi:MAG: hypothetical protein V1494_01205 [Candidatus Diapherotrites archaeon]